MSPPNRSRRSVTRYDPKSKHHRSGLKSNHAFHVDAATVHLIIKTDYQHPGIGLNPLRVVSTYLGLAWSMNARSEATIISASRSVVSYLCCGTQAVWTRRPTGPCVTAVGTVGLQRSRPD